MSICLASERAPERAARRQAGQVRGLVWARPGSGEPGRTSEGEDRRKAFEVDIKVSKINTMTIAPMGASTNITLRSCSGDFGIAPGGYLRASRNLS
jgi:hypothetical protein